MSWETLLLFAATEFLLCLTPGPAVLFVLGLSMRQGTFAGAAASAGVVAGTALYFVLSALGIGALIVASHTLFTIVKWVGAAYLVYLGVGMALPLIRQWRTGVAAPSPARLAGGGGAGEAGHWAGAFWRGFAVQMANPKTLMFFLALFPQFISPDGNVALQFLLMGVVSAVIEMPILVAYAALGAASAHVLKARVMAWVEAVAGSVLVGLGAALAASRRA